MWRYSPWANSEIGLIFGVMRAERWRKVSWYQMKEQHPPFNFLLVSSFISCTLSLYRGLKLCVSKMADFQNIRDEWGRGNKIHHKFRTKQLTVTNDPLLHLPKIRLLNKTKQVSKFDLEHKLKVKSGSFWGQGENWWGQNHQKKVIFSCSRIKIVSTTTILVLKLAHKEYQRKKITFSVKKDKECGFSGQKQTNIELHRSAHLGVRH